MKEYQTLIGFFVLSIALLASALIVSDELELIASAISSVAGKLSVIAAQIASLTN
ncbi:MAG: hypothetical protein J6A10_04310 [Peptococcaceae bacterium]|nr:hypothetical protein [Peptococcaceae bacterium]MBO5139811.1 hypothetical protein [Peptococcaceae bacterium]MBO5302088.1 hypothetical protein [Peptococcaceae bacterium]MBO5429171.1 hypothetical protein [Peptococcaceae bacterium]MBP3626191.1 hypothetical protein [Peptococcaceae bacterium]